VININLLKDIALFEGLEESDLKKISGVVKEKVAPKGTVLFKEGDIGDAFYLLQQGAVEILKNEGGKEKLVYTIDEKDPNDFFGELALCGGAPRNATVRTTKDSTLLVISKSDFDMLLRLNSFIALRIMTALSKRLRSESRDASVEAKRGKAIVVFSPKSGSGKTIFATNLAAGLSKIAGAKVLLIDLDLQFGDLAFNLAMKVKRTIADLVENPTDKFEVLKEYIIEHKTGFAVLPAPLKPEQSETITSAHLRALVDVVRKHFDFIIIDTHSLFQDLTINAMDLADFIHLIMIPNMNHIKNMHLCLKVMENLKYAPEKIKLILNREGCQYGRTKEEIEAGLKRKVDFTLKDDWKQVCELLDHQKTLYELDSDSTYRDDLFPILEAVTGKKFEDRGKGLIGKIKGWFAS